MYTLVSTSTFDEAYKKLIKGDQEKEKRTKKTIKLMRTDLFYPSLKSHKVNTRSFGKRWSSWITADLRIIWDFDTEEKVRIILFAVVTHTGTHREYK
ncbi:MAG TPA: hypothetical protein VM077_03400 [Candidatus Limnocylindrales bacterium]|nr:hypothetical protein [Candidatus Limnocylindrales bacterium]